MQPNCNENLETKSLRGKDRAAAIKPVIKAADKGKRRMSKRLKKSKSQSSLLLHLSSTIEDSTVSSAANEDMSLSEQCDEILKSTDTKNEDHSTYDTNIVVLPSGVDPFDEDPNPEYVSEYAESIFQNMRKREVKYPVVNYLLEGTETGRSTTPIMRAILVDWLVEVQENFQLYHETLYLSVKVLDSYLQHQDTPKEDLQLVGATCLLIACNIEERAPPPIDDFVYICDDAYTSNKFIEMEMNIFKTLAFDINIPISYRYLSRFSRVTQMSMDILTLSRFVLEL